MEDMNDYGFWSQGARCYEKLRVVHDMNDSKLWIQGFKYYE